MPCFATGLESLLGFGRSNTFEFVPITGEDYGRFQVIRGN